MEQQWNQRAEEHQSQTSELVCQINQSQKLLSLLQNSHQIALEESKARLHKLSSDRERIGQAHDMFSRIFRVRIYPFFLPNMYYVVFVLIFSNARN